MVNTVDKLSGFFNQPSIKSRSMLQRVFEYLLLKQENGQELKLNYIELENFAQGYHVKALGLSPPAIETVEIHAEEAKKILEAKTEAYKTKKLICLAKQKLDKNRLDLNEAINAVLEPKSSKELTQKEAETIALEIGLRAEDADAVLTRCQQLTSTKQNSKQISSEIKKDLHAKQ